MPNITSSSNKFLIIIAGPTAVGKTNLAVQVALKYNAEIFSADSRQIYKELNIGTAKPDQSDTAMIRHHFIDHVSIFQNYSVGQYFKEISEALSSYFENNQIAVVTGGTGLYLRAIAEGLDEFPDIPDEIVDFYNEVYKKEGILSLQNELKSKDPAYFEKVDIRNPRRLMRALSVIHISNNTFTSFLNQRQIKIPSYTHIPILLEIPRERLYNQINKRVDHMILTGLADEAKELYLYKDLKALETVGYQELFTYFDGNLTYEQAIDLIKQNTRRYAKRQMTWFRKYGNWTTFSPDEKDIIIKFINRQLLV